MKTFSPVFSPEALKDIDDAFEYYEQRQLGSGKRFAVQLQSTLNAMKRNPFFAPVRYDDVCCAQVKKFPFLVHYHIDEINNRIIVIAVYSTYREPLG
jgi:hypothetical protein